MRLRQRSGITGPNGALLEYPLSTAQFIVPLQNTLIPSAGYGPATFTRATTATMFDNEGKLVTTRIGAARFTGARRVGNLISRSEDVTNSWIVSNLTPSTSNIITVANGFLVNYLYNNVNYPMTIGQKYCLMFRVTYRNQAIVQLFGNTSGFGTSQYANFDLINGTTNATGCVSGIRPVSSGVWDIYAVFTAIATTSSNLGGLSFQTNLSSNRLANFTGDGTQTLQINYAQSEDVTGQVDQTPSEYIHSGRTPPNLLTYTEELSASVYNNTNTTITQNAIANPVDGRVNATKVEATSSAATTFYQAINGIGSASGMTLSVYIKKGSGTTDANRFILYNATTSTQVVNAIINYDAGTTPAGTLTPLSNGWYKLVLSSATGFSDGDNIRCFFCFLGNAETANEFAYVYGPTLVQGVADPSYTPIGAAYDPHGSGADGVKFFNTNKDGTPITNSTMKGFKIERSRSNNLLWCRDLTNATWVKTTMTTALTETGIDGLVNGATRLTASAGNATCLQTFTMTSATRTFTAYVKRISGSGTIQITRDNGTGWTDITSLISTGVYTRVYIEGTSVTNPTCGFRIVTNGDVIAVDYCQDEATDNASNPILTTTTSVTAGQDILYYPTPSNVSFTAGTCATNLALDKINGTMDSQSHAVTLGNNGRIFYINSGNVLGRVNAYDGTNNPNATGYSRAGGTLRKAALNWSGSTMNIITEGNTATSSSSFVGVFGNYPAIVVGASTIAGSSSWRGNIRDLYFWPTALSDTQLYQLVT